MKQYLGIFIGISLAIAFSVFAFTEPTVAPPGGNVAAPINVSGTAQTKVGNLTVGTMFANNFAVPAGTEGDITNIDEIIGFNDLILRGNTTNAAPIYLEGSKIILNNDTGTGNVGIGTANPESTLTIRRSTAGKAFAIRNTADSADTFSIDNTGTIASGSVPWVRLISFPAACPSGQFVTAVGGTLACATPGAGGGTLGGSGATNFVSKFTAASTLGNSSIFDNGFVGIGTVSPEIKLHVRGGATWGSGLDLDARDVAGGRQWRLASTGGDAGQGQGKFVLYDQTAGQNRLVVDTNGNVGIGTTNTIVNFEVFKSSGSGGPITRFRNDSTGYAYADFMNSNNLLRIGKESSTGGVLLTGSTPNAGILATQGVNPLQFGTNDAVAMTILSGGNVGIGKTNPGAMLDVGGSIIRIGVPTASFQNQIQVADVGGGYPSILGGSLGTTAGTGKTFLQSIGSGGIQLMNSSGLVVLMVANNGAVGIGNPAQTPNYTLDVRGSVGATYLYSSSDVTAANRVCIGSDCRSSWPAGVGATPYFFVVGNDTNIYYKAGVGGSWTQVPGGCCVSGISAPPAAATRDSGFGLSAARDSSNNIHIVVRGGDGQAYEKIFYSNGSWSGYSLVASGSFQGVPAVETRN